MSLVADWYSQRPSILAIALRPLSLAFGAVVALRRALYRSGLRRTVALPLTLQPLAVNRPVSAEAVNRALGSDRLICLILQRTDADDPTPDDLHRVGTVGVIRQMAKTGGGMNIIVEGLARVRADLITRTGTSMRAQITPMPESSSVPRSSKCLATRSTSCAGDAE